MESSLVTRDKLTEFLFVFRCRDIGDTDLAIESTQEYVHIFLHARIVFVQNTLYLVDRIERISDIVHLHLSLSLLISFREYDDITIVDECPENPGVFGVYGFYLFCIHGLAVVEHTDLIIEEDLTRNHDLKIHLLIDHCTEIAIKKSHLDDEQKCIYETERGRRIAVNQYAHYIREGYENGASEKDYEDQDSLIEEILKSSVRELALGDSGVDVLYIRFISLDIAKSLYIEYHDDEPPKNIGPEKDGKSGRSDIIIGF